MCVWVKEEWLRSGNGKSMFRRILETDKFINGCSVINRLRTDFEFGSLVVCSENLQVA